jgi:AcrR family transcriptional regulator
MAMAERTLESTRQRVLDAALDLFGERGFAGTTVRDIAGRAKVNVAAISYHFGGKAELYRAVAQMVIDGIEARVRSRAASVLDASPADPAAALAGLETLIETVVDVIVGPPEMRRVARFVIREQMQPTAAFEVLFGTMSRLHMIGCGLFGRAAGLDPESAETRLRVFLLLGQAIFLRIAEAAVLRRMQIDHYDDAFLATVKAALKQNLRAVVAVVREGRP